MSEETRTELEQFALLFVCSGEQKLCASPIFKGVPVLYSSLGLGKSSKTMEDILSEASACKTVEEFCTMVQQLQEKDYALIGYSKDIQPVRVFDSTDFSGFWDDPDIKVYTVWAPAGTKSGTKEESQTGKTPEEAAIGSAPKMAKQPAKPEEAHPNSVLMNAPQLLPEWNFSRNINADPKRHPVTATKSVWWRCSKCGNEWLASVANRLKGLNGCNMCNRPKVEEDPYPTGVVQGVNDLASKSPQLAAEWDDEANAPLHACDVKYNYPKIVGWKCPKCQTKWNAGVYYRYHKHGAPCPSCKANGLLKDDYLPEIEPTATPADDTTTGRKTGRQKTGKWGKNPKWTLPDTKPEITDFVTGARVSHRNYGEGVVRMRFQSPTGDEMATVFFEEKNREETLFLAYSLTQMYVL